MFYNTFRINELYKSFIFGIKILVKTFGRAVVKLYLCTRFEGVKAFRLDDLTSWE